MERDSVSPFTLVNIELFNRVDKMIEDNDYKEQSNTIYQMIDEVKDTLIGDIEDIFSITISISCIASIICTDDDDHQLDIYGFPLDESNVIIISEDLTDLVLDGKIEYAMEYIENELIKREKYELLKEMKVYEKNS